MTKPQVEQWDLWYLHPRIHPRDNGPAVLRARRLADTLGLRDIALCAFRNPGGMRMYLCFTIGRLGRLGRIAPDVPGEDWVAGGYDGCVRASARSCARLFSADLNGNKGERMTQPKGPRTVQRGLHTS